MTRNARIAILIALFWAVVVIVLHWNAPKLDTSAIYYAAKSWAAGRPDLVYAPGPFTFLIEVPPEWRAWADAEGWQRAVYFTPYLYPPLWAVLLAPLAAAIPSVVFYNGVLLVNVGVSLWMVWLAWRLFAPKETNPALWSGISFATLIGTAVCYLPYEIGQPQIIVSAITLAAFAALGRGRDMTAGGLLALAAAIKLSPALLIVVFVMERRWRALAAFAGVGVAFAALSVLVAGWPLHAEFLEKIGLIDERILVSRIVVSAELVLFQLSEMLQGTASWVIGTPRMVMEPAWITWVTGLILVVGLISVWWTSREAPDRERLWLRLIGTLLITLLTNPLGWMHYLILPFLLLPGLFAFLTSRRAGAILGAVLIPFSMPVYLALVSFGAGDWLQVAINVGVVAGLFLVIQRIGTRRG